MIEFVESPTVELITHNVSDNLACQAARVSTGTTGDPDRDRGLIRALIRDHHGVPFEHGSMTFRIEVPLFVMPQWLKHRAGWSVSEESGRYRELQPRFYQAPAGRAVRQIGKAMDYDMREDDGLLADFRLAQRLTAERAWETYQAVLADGVARELARTILPTTIMKTAVVTCNPRSLMHFLSLRTSGAGTSHPQWEIEQAARLLETHWADLMPLTHAAFVENGRVAP